MRHAIPVTFERGGLVPPLALGVLFAAIGFKVGIPAAVAGAIGVTCGTASLIVHELGHIRAARRLKGVRPVSISLVWLGAGARMEGAYRSGRDQMRVALAGPAASMCAALALMPLMFLPIPGTVKKLLFVVVLLNAALAVVNLIPVSPLDGYRILVGLLWRVLGDEGAARRALWRAARGWIAVEVAATALVMVERPMLGIAMVLAGASLLGQRLLVRSHSAHS